MKKILIILFFALGAVVQGQTFSTLLADRTKIFNVKDYRATGDGVTDDTDEIQACIDAAGDGTVFFPAGNYLIDSLLITKSPTLIGVGRDWATASSCSRLVSKTALPIITIDYHIGGGAGYATGAIIRNLYIKGDNHADNGVHKQTGICVNGEASVTLDGVYIANCGDYAVRILTTYDTDLVTVDNCRLEDNTRGGIYAKRTGTLQLNAIRITNNNIISNNGFGINVLGNNVIIEKNIIQGNDSAGVYMSARDLGNVNATSYNTVINNNYFEQNKGGNIVMKAYWQSGAMQYHYYTTISNNYMYLSDATANADVTASVIFKLASGSAAVKGIRYMVFSNNYIEVDGTLYMVDGQSRLDNTCNFHVTDVEQTAANTYNGITGAAIYGRKTARPFVSTGTVVAGTGITEAMLADNMYFNTASAIDISANPQIADGWDGQEITIVGSSDTNTLTLDDGTGLALSGQWVGGVGDAITLTYNATLDLWVEKNRSNN